MGEPVEQRGRHLRVAEDARPLAEGEIGRNDDRSLLVETADEVEEELTAGLSEGQIAELVEDDEIEAGEVIGDAALASGARLSLEPIDEIDDIVEAGTGRVADAAAGDGDREVGLAGPGAADEDGIALLSQEGAGRQVPNQGLVDGGAVELELGQLFRQRRLGDAELIADRAGVLFGDLRLEQLADDLRHRMLALQPVADHLVEGGAHPGQLQLAHHLDDLVTLHQMALRKPS
jgi:hypothetical protein